MHDDRLKLTEGVLSIVRMLKGIAYGVSQLHGEVSRRLFKKWADLITHVTNGSFLPFWRHELLKTLAGATEEEQKADLMAKKQVLKREMIERIYEETGVKLDEEDPIVFFGRRMAEYKRLGMTVHDEVIHTMLKSIEEGGLHMQYIIAGIPYGEYGLKIIERVDYLRTLGYRIVYMPDYDVNLEVNKLLFAGSDFMLHIPQRPHEASGTSYQMGSMNATIVGASYDGGPLEHIFEFNEETKEGNGVFLKEWAEGFEVGNVYAEGDAGSRQALVEMFRKMRRIYDNPELLAAVRWNAYKTSAQIMTADRMLKEYYVKLYETVMKEDGRKQWSWKKIFTLGAKEDDQSRRDITSQEIFNVVKALVAAEQEAAARALREYAQAIRSLEEVINYDSNAPPMTVAHYDVKADEIRTVSYEEVVVPTLTKAGYSLEQIERIWSFIIEHEAIHQLLTQQKLRHEEIDVLIIQLSLRRLLPGAAKYTPEQIMALVQVLYGYSFRLKHPDYSRPDA